MTWTTPRLFEETSNITPPALNKYLKDNFDYLFQNKREQKKYAIADYAINVADFASLDNGQFTLRLDMPAESDLMFWFSAISTTDALNVWMAIDILMDGVTYLSSMTDTPLSNGMFVDGHRTNAVEVAHSFFFVATRIPAGLHTFDLVIKRLGTGTITLLSTKSPIIFGVKEI